MRAGSAIAALAVLALAGGLLPGCGRGAEAAARTQPAVPPSLTAAAARQALASFDRAFYVGNARHGFYVDSARTGLADFWKEAEMIETVEDFYRLTGDRAYERQVVALCQGVVDRYGSDWMYLPTAGGHGRIGQRANDDVMWMVIAFARAHAISGIATYLDAARQNFDRVYARAWSSALGGGLWWRTASDRPGKNTTTNAPAVIAAAELYGATHDSTYLARATAVYRWLRTHLYDAHSGRVYDGVMPAAAGGISVSRVRYTYNQGSFIGAANELYAVTRDRAYYDDALNALVYTTRHMTRDGILQNDSTGPDQDAGGFKGIFARWALRFARDNTISRFDSWFRLNADMAWSEKNSGGVVGWDWMAKTGTGTLYSWDCSSAVAMMEALLPAHGG